jgi:hypothetical protein
MLSLMNGIFLAIPQLQFMLLTPHFHPQPKRQVVLHQGGDTDTNNVSPPVIAPIPAIPPPALPEQQPAPLADVLPDAAPLPDLAPEPERLPEPRRQNPPRLHRYTGSLKESVLTKRSLQVPPAHVPPPPSELSSDELNIEDGDELEANLTLEQGLQYVFTSQIDDYLSQDEGLEYAYATALKTSSHDNEPRTLREAMQRSPEESAKWHKAAMDEIQALVENGI